MCKAWYTAYPDYLCVLGYRAGITSAQFHPLCSTRLGLAGRGYAVCPEGHFTYPFDRSAAHSPPIAYAWPGGANAP